MKYELRIKQTIRTQFCLRNVVSFILHNSYLILLALFLASCLIPHNSAFAGTIYMPPNNLGLVGYWSFDDGSGTRVEDLSGNGNHGTLKSMESSDWVSGKRGGALSFDGNSEYVSIGTTGINNIDSEITVSGWIYPKNTDIMAVISNDRECCSTSKGFDVHYGYGATGNIRAGIWSGGQLESLHSNAGTVTPNTWTFFSITYDDTNFNIYVNGRLATTTPSSGNGIDTPANRDLVIGVLAWDKSSYNFNGSIDDLRVYNRALSDGEVESLYSSGATKHSQLSEANLIAHWKFDDGSGTRAEDSTSGENHGTLTNMESTDWISGKRGGALSFDGQDEYVETATPSMVGTTYSVCAWFKTADDSSTQIIYSERNSANENSIKGQLYLDDGLISFITRNDSSGNSALAQSSVVVETTTWLHACGVRSGSNVYVYLNGSQKGTDDDAGGTITTNVASIGTYNDAGDFTTHGFLFDGSIDDVRIYNTALSADDIQTLYRQGQVTYNASQNQKLTDGLIGLWSFDGPDLTSTTVLDRSGQGNDGTLQNGPKPTRGAIGQALEFDGVDDHIDANDVYDFANSTPFSISVWAKPEDFDLDFQALLAKRTENDDGWIFIIRPTNDPSPKLAMQFWSNSAASSVTSDVDVAEGQWSQLAFTFDGTTGKLYINGTEVGSGTMTKVLPDTPTDLTFGAGQSTGDLSQYFDGSIDDVRIYNRAISSQEVKQLWSMGRR